MVTFTYTIFILAFNLLIVIFFQDNIEEVLDFTGGILGVLLMMTFPSLFVILGRRKKKDLYVLILFRKKTNLKSLQNLNIYLKQFSLLALLFFF